jgi:hypothetical protein
MLLFNRHKTKALRILNTVCLDGMDVNPEASIIGLVPAVAVDLLLDPLDSRLVV